MSERTIEISRHKANPDDPPVQRPPQGLYGPLPGPNFLGLEGRIAIMQSQVFLLALIMIMQLWLITNALNELLSGQTATLGWLVLASGIGFALALLTTIGPRRSIGASYKANALNVVRESPGPSLQEAKIMVNKAPNAITEVIFKKEETEKIAATP